MRIAFFSQWQLMVWEVEEKALVYSRVSRALRVARDDRRGMIMHP